MPLRVSISTGVHITIVSNKCFKFFLVLYMCISDVRVERNHFERVVYRLIGKVLYVFNFVSGKQGDQSSETNTEERFLEPSVPSPPTTGYIMAQKLLSKEQTQGKFSSLASVLF